jgi:hypothetical protein
LYTERRRSQRTKSNDRISLITQNYQFGYGGIENMSDDGVFVLMDNADVLSIGMLVDVKIVELNDQPDLPGLAMEVIRIEGNFVALRYFDQLYCLDTLFRMANPSGMNGSEIL